MPDTGGAPLISVVIPTYNRLDLLRQAIESVVAQTYPNWELIVVDDGSTDSTADHLTSLTAFPVRYLRRSHTGNVAATRNAGAYAANGRYLAFLDSDDLWHRSKLEVQMAQMLGAGVSWSYTCYDLIELDGGHVPFRGCGWKPFTGHIAEAVLSTEASIAISTLVVATDLFNQVGGFDEDARINFREDYELVVRLALAGATLAVSACLASVREHPGRATRGLANAVPFVTTAYAYTKVLPLLPAKELVRVARRRRAYHLAEAGSRYLAEGAVGPAVRCLVRSLADGVQPRQWASAVARGLGWKSWLKR